MPSRQTPQPSSNPDPLLTVEQTAEWLSISPRHVYRLRDSGELAPLRIGRLVRFRVSEVERYLNGSGGTP